MTKPAHTSSRKPKRTSIDAAFAAYVRHGVDPRTIVIDLVDNRIFTVSKPITTLPPKKGAKSDWQSEIKNWV